MGIFNQKPKFKVTAPTIRKVVVPVEIAKPKPQAKPRDSNSAPATASRSKNLSVRPAFSARSSKTLSVSPRSSTSPTGRASLSPLPTDDRRNGRNGDRKRKLVRAAVHRPSPASDRVEFGKDSDTEDDDWEATLNEREHRKRKRLNDDRHVDLNRHLVHPVLLATVPRKKEEVAASAGAGGGDGLEKAQGLDAKKLDIIHARDVASLALKCVPVLNAAEDEVVAELQYPGSRHRER